jgi:Putative transmembrane protein (PGPGW)
VVGLALLVLPGPGLLLLTAGLALLATEFPWAQRWLTRLRGHAKQAAQRVRPAKPSA